MNTKDISIQGSIFLECTLVNIKHALALLWFFCIIFTGLETKLIIKKKSINIVGTLKKKKAFAPVTPFCSTLIFKIFKNVSEYWPKKEIFSKAQMLSYNRLSSEERFDCLLTVASVIF